MVSTPPSAGVTARAGRQQRPSAREMRQARFGRPVTPDGGWVTAQRGFALIILIALGSRTTVVSSINVTAGLVLGVLSLPLWIAGLASFRGARLVAAGCVAALVSGAVLTQVHSADHVTSGKLMTANSVMLLTLLVGMGVVLWARTLLPPGLVACAFGVGMILGISSTSGLFSSNPWRFGFSVPITVFVLGLALLWRSRWLEFAAAVALMLVSAASDARSSSAILLLTALFIGWQMIPRAKGRRGSAARVILAVAALAAVVYSVGESLILSGSLGEETQQRSQAQVDTSGSLILGGRPELAATASLMRNYPGGFGSGTEPSHAELNVAKAGMAAINYDPNNGYVERFMFGTGFEVHSTFGDLWANFGLVGLVLAVVITGVALRGFGQTLSERTASGIVLYLMLKLLWNMFFAPVQSGLPLMILLLGLLLVPRSAPSPEATEAQRTARPLRGGRPADVAAPLVAGTRR